MNSGDYDKAFFDYLINLDSINYNFNNKPETTLYKEMKLAYRDNIIDFLENQIMKNKMNTIKHKATDLFNDYLNFLKDGNFKNDISIKKFSMKLKLLNILPTRGRECNYYIIDYNDLKKYLINKNLLEDSESDSD